MNKIVKTLVSSSVFLTFIASLSTVFADGRVEKVLESKKITVGAREGAPPFGFVNEKGDWVGWSMDLSKAIHQTIEKKLGTKYLKSLTKVLKSHFLL